MIAMEFFKILYLSFKVGKAHKFDLSRVQFKF